MNCTELDVLLSPAEFEGLPEQDLSDTSCVVFDVLRATSTMTVALANGAEAILPCATIGEAIATRESEPGLLLAGERGGQRITAEISGRTEFDLGNSPREMTRDVVAGNRMAATTTNGTRALKACSGSKAVWIGSFLNLTALGQAIRDGLCYATVVQRDDHRRLGIADHHRPRPQRRVDAFMLRRAPAVPGQQHRVRWSHIHPGHTDGNFDYLSLIHI